MGDTIEIFDLEAHLNDTFLIGGYRVKKGQQNWIFGKKPRRNSILYNTRFRVVENACRNGAMGTGEKPDFVALYDYATRKKVRLFTCVSYSIKTPHEMIEMGYPIQENKTHSYIIYELGTEYDSKDIHISKIIKFAHQKYRAYKQALIIEQLTKNPKLSRRQLGEILGLSADSVKWYIQQMQESGFIRHVGSDKGGHWEILS